HGTGPYKWIAGDAHKGDTLLHQLPVAMRDQVVLVLKPHLAVLAAVAALHKDGALQAIGAVGVDIAVADHGRWPIEARAGELWQGRNGIQPFGVDLAQFGAADLDDILVVIAPQACL